MLGHEWWASAFPVLEVLWGLVSCLSAFQDTEQGPKKCL